MGSLAQYEVPREYADNVYNYLVYGFEPGSFYTSVFANDFMGAMTHSHPGNSILGLKYLSIWVGNHLPKKVAWGSYECVERWLKMREHNRRSVLENLNLIYTEQQEIVMVLKDEPVLPVYFNN